MKEYKVGEVFTSEDGKTVQCVRSNGFCSGCVFLAKIGDPPRCKAMDINCSECSREDNRDVVFKEIEHITPIKEYKPGTVLTYKDKLIICKECKPEDHCESCILWDEDCLSFPCHYRDRSDGKSVHFIEVKDFDGSKKYKPGDIVNVSGRLMQAEMKITFVNYANEE